MSFERKITAAGLAREVGARPDPAVVGSGGELVVEGQSLGVSERGHEDHGQTIHRNFELSNFSMTARYGEGMPGYNMEPTDGSAYVLRADGQLDISLGKPPAVPADQVPPPNLDGTERKPRTRFWRLSVLVFSASDSNVTWPAGVKWSGGEQPINPRPAGTADRIELEYVERTGEWWATVTHAAVVSEDPQEEDPDATEPPTDEDAPEDGAPPPEDNPPDHTYTDPDTGEVLEPVQPLAMAGNLVALHAAYLSVSDDCGRTWRVVRGVPQYAADIHLNKQLGAIARANTEAYVSTDLMTWTPLRLRAERDAKITPVNGDFEAGDLTNWNVVSDMAPVVLDTVQPPQRGGKFYLCRDANLENPTPYAVSRRLSVPAGEIFVSADALAEIGGEAKLTIKKVIAAPTQEGRFNTLVMTGSLTKVEPGNSRHYAKQFRHAGGFDVDVTWEVVGGDVTPYFHIGSNYPNGGFDIRDTGTSTNNREAIMKVKFTKDGQPVSVSGAFDISSIIQRAANSDQVWVGNATIEPIKDVEMVAQKMNEFTYGEIAQVYEGRSSSGRVRVRFADVDHFYLSLSGASGGRVSEMIPVAPRSTTETIGDTSSAMAASNGSWHQIDASVFLEEPGEVEIQLDGAGNAYFDNIFLIQRREQDETVTAIASDRLNERFLIATSDRLHIYSKEKKEPLGPLPFAGVSLLSAGPAGILISDGVQVALSTDDGETFDILALPGLSDPAAVVVDLFAASGLHALYSDGEITAISDEGTAVIGKLPAGSRLSYSARVQRWLATTPAGDMTRSADLVTWEPIPDMPQSVDAGPRRILATDIGRTVGWSSNSKDIFYTDAPAGKWSVGYSLTTPIKSVREVR